MPSTKEAPLINQDNEDYSPTNPFDAVILSLIEGNETIKEYLAEDNPQAAQEFVNENLANIKKLEAMEKPKSGESVFEGLDETLNNIKAELQSLITQVGNSSEKKPATAKSKKQKRKNRSSKAKAKANNTPQAQPSDPQQVASQSNDDEQKIVEQQLEHGVELFTQLFSRQRLEGSQTLFIQQAPSNQQQLANTLYSPEENLPKGCEKIIKAYIKCCNENGELEDLFNQKEHQTTLNNPYKLEALSVYLLNRLKIGAGAIQGVTKQTLSSSLKTANLDLKLAIHLIGLLEEKNSELSFKLQMIVVHLTFEVFHRRVMGFKNKEFDSKEMFPQMKFVEADFDKLMKQYEVFYQTLLSIAKKKIKPSKRELSTIKQNSWEINKLSIRATIIFNSFCYNTGQHERMHEIFNLGNVLQAKINEFIRLEFYPQADSCQSDLATLQNDSLQPQLQMLNGSETKRIRLINLIHANLIQQLAAFNIITEPSNTPDQPQAEYTLEELFEKTMMDNPDDTKTIVTSFASFIAAIKTTAEKASSMTLKSLRAVTEATTEWGKFIKVYYPHPLGYSINGQLNQVEEKITTVMTEMDNPQADEKAQQPSSTDKTIKTLQSLIDGLKDKALKLTAENSELEQQLSTAKNETKTTANKHKNLIAHQRRLEAAINKNKQKHKSSVEEIKALKSTIDKLEQTNQQLCQNNIELSKQLAASKQKLAHKNKLLAEQKQQTQRQYGLKEEQLVINSQQAADIQNLTQESKATIARLETQSKRQTTQIVQLSADSNNKDLTISQQSQVIARLSAQVEQLQKQAAAAQQDLQQSEALKTQAQQQKQTIEQLMASFNSLTLESTQDKERILELEQAQAQIDRLNTPSPSKGLPTFSYEPIKDKVELQAILNNLAQQEEKFGVTEEGYATIEVPDSIYKTLRNLRSDNHRAALTGGAIIDILKGHKPNDYDIITTNPDVAKLGAKQSAVKPELHKINSDNIEIVVATDLDWAKDANRRDASVTALQAIPTDKPNQLRIIDCVGGLKDFLNGHLRMLNNEHGCRFEGCPKLILRYTRFLVQKQLIGNQFDCNQIRFHKNKLNEMPLWPSIEEFAKLFKPGTANIMLSKIFEFGLYSEMFPVINDIAPNTNLEQGKIFDFWRSFMHEVDIKHSEKHSIANKTRFSKKLDINQYYVAHALMLLLPYTELITLYSASYNSDAAKEKALDELFTRFFKKNQNHNSNEKYDFVRNVRKHLNEVNFSYHIWQSQKQLQQQFNINPSNVRQSAAPLSYAIGSPPVTPSFRSINSQTTSTSRSSTPSVSSISSDHSETSKSSTPASRSSNHG